MATADCALDYHDSALQVEEYLLTLSAANLVPTRCDFCSEVRATPASCGVIALELRVAPPGARLSDALQGAAARVLELKTAGGLATRLW